MRHLAKWSSWFVLCTFVCTLVACGSSVEGGEGSTPGDCSDGADNDGDGDFDCGDSGCRGAPVCGGLDAGVGDDASVTPCMVASDCPSGETCGAAGICVPGTATDPLCNETCIYTDDGECDDGGDGASTSLCALGSDCIDCGPRTPSTCACDTGASCQTGCGCDPDCSTGACACDRSRSICEAGCECDANCLGVGASCTGRELDCTRPMICRRTSLRDWCTTTCLEHQEGTQGSCPTGGVCLCFLRADDSCEYLCDRP